MESMYQLITPMRPADRINSLRTGIQLIQATVRPGSFTSLPTPESRLSGSSRLRTYSRSRGAVARIRIHSPETSTAHATLDGGEEDP